MAAEEAPPAHKRRPRYAGRNPRAFRLSELESHSMNHSDINGARQMGLNLAVAVGVSVVLSVRPKDSTE